MLHVCVANESEISLILQIMKRLTIDEEFCVIHAEKWQEAANSNSNTTLLTV